MDRKSQTIAMLKNRHMESHDDTAASAVFLWVLPFTFPVNSISLCPLTLLSHKIFSADKYAEIISKIKSNPETSG